jgi:hypothetical protein
MLIDDTNPYEPLKEVISIYYTTFSKSLSKTIITEYNPIIVQTDLGLVTANVVE